MDRRHPSAQQAFPSLACFGRGRGCAAALQLGKILIGMVSARVAAGINRGRVEALLRADERVPRVGTAAGRIPPPGGALGLGGAGLPISGAASRTWISSGSPPPARSLSASRSGSELAISCCDEPEKRHGGLRKARLRALSHHASRAAGRNERDGAVALAQILVHLPGRVVVWKFALQRVAAEVRRFGLLGSSGATGSACATAVVNAML